MECETGRPQYTPLFGLSSACRGTVIISASGIVRYKAMHDRQASQRYAASVLSILYCGSVGTALLDALLQRLAWRNQSALAEQALFHGSKASQCIAVCSAARNLIACVASVYSSTLSTQLAAVCAKSNQSITAQICTL